MVPTISSTSLLKARRSAALGQVLPFARAAVGADDEVIHVFFGAQRKQARCTAPDQTRRTNTRCDPEGSIGDAA